MAQQKREVDGDRQQTAAPTFDNTVVALERSGLLLERANLAFRAVNGANTNDTLQATDTKTVAAVRRALRLHLPQPEAVRARQVLSTTIRPSSNLNPEQAKLLDVYYKQFVHAGAELPPAKQAAAQGDQHSG